MKLTEQEQQDLADAWAIVHNMHAVRQHDAEAILRRLVARVFGVAQDLILQVATRV